MGEFDWQCNSIATIKFAFTVIKLSKKTVLMCLLPKEQKKEIMSQARPLLSTLGFVFFRTDAQNSQYTISSH